MGRPTLKTRFFRLGKSMKNGSFVKGWAFISYMTRGHLHNLYPIMRFDFIVLGWCYSFVDILMRIQPISHNIKETIYVFP